MIVGFFFALVVGLAIPVLFVGSAISALVMSYIETKGRLRFRMWVAWFIYIEAAGAFVVGVLLIFGFGVLSVGAAMTLFTTAGIVLGIFEIVLSLFLFWIGNIVHGSWHLYR